MESKGWVVFDIETTGLFPWRGDRVTCIVAKNDKGEIFTCVDKDEGKVIQEFIMFLGKSKEKPLLVTKNGEFFDIPFVCVRQILLARNLGRSIPNISLLHYESYDIQDITWKNISLDDMAKLFNIPGKFSTGKAAINMFNDGKFDELVKYCLQDVLITEYVYRFHKGETGLEKPGEVGFSATVV